MKTHLHEAVRVACGFHHRFSFVDRVADWLFHIDVRAGLECGLRRRDVLGRWRADVNDVRPGAGQQRQDRRIGLGPRRGRELVRAVGKPIVHADDARRPAAPRDGVEMIARHLTGADECDTKRH